MKQKFYFVVSVREIKHLLRIAERSEAVHGNGDNHCVVLHGLQAAEQYEDQLSTLSFSSALRQLTDEVEAAEQVRKFSVQPEAEPASGIVSDSALVCFKEAVQRALTSHDDETGSALKTVIEFEAPRPGQKFVRFTTRHGTSNRSAYCFVELATGDILKPDGWKRPARGVRGNIRKGDASNWFHGALGPYGTRSLR